MEYVGIGIINIAAIAVGIILYIKSKKKDAASSDAIGDVNTPSVDVKGALAEIHQADELVNQLPRCKHSSTVLGSYIAVLEKPEFCGIVSSLHVRD